MADNNINETQVNQRNLFIVYNSQYKEVVHDTESRQWEGPHKGGQRDGGLQRGVVSKQRKCLGEILSPDNLEHR